MSLLEALLLGLIQGLTEFLPVSSSAHLVFFQHLLGFKEPLLFFDVLVHLGTLAAVFVYFAGDLAHLIRDSIYAVSFAFRRKPWKEILEIASYARWTLGLLVASIPTGLIGFLFKDWFESMFGSLRGVGIALFGTTMILWLTRYFQRGERKIEKCGFLDYLTIGFFQGIAITPGISRSGSTIAAALFRGLERETAFRFSFLLAIPAILGAGLLELRHGFELSFSEWPAYGIGFVVSAISGYLSIFFLSAVMRKGKLHWFALYTLLFGCAVLFSSRWFE